MVEQMEAATGASANAYEKWVGLVTSHGYSSPPTTPLPTEGKKVWETECQCYLYSVTMRKSGANVSTLGADLSDQGQQPWVRALHNR